MEHHKLKIIAGRILILLPFFLLVMLGSCYYDNEQELYPPGSGNCDTTKYTFSGTIYPIINDYCIECHSGASPQGIVLIYDYKTISDAGKIPAGIYGSLYGTVAHSAGNKPMPYNRPNLSECNVIKIKKWIDAGTPNN
jgi:hypothetical protein